MKTTVYIVTKTWDPFFGHRVHHPGDILFVTPEPGPDYGYPKYRVVKTSRAGTLPGWGMLVPDYELNGIAREWRGE